MIEIKLDGPLGPHATGGYKNQVRIIGVGHAGVAALDYIVVRGSGECDMTVIDTDQQVLQASVVSDKMLLGFEFTRGLGCGGDLELAEEVAATCQEQFSQITDGAEYILICTGLGGGTGSVFAPELVRHAHKHGAKVIVLASMPFAFQGRRLYCQALDCLAKLRSTADAVMVFANDRLSGVPSVAGNIRHGFHLLNQFAGRTLNSLAQVLSKHGFIQLTFADLRSLFGRLHGTEVIENCWAGCGEVSPDENDISKLINQVIDSPLFQDETAWRNADHAVVCLTGGRELSLSEVEDILAELQERLPSELPVAAGTHLDASGDGTLRMTLLLAATSAPVVEMLPGGEDSGTASDYGISAGGSGSGSAAAAQEAMASTGTGVSTVTISPPQSSTSAPMAAPSFPVPDSVPVPASAPTPRQTSPLMPAMASAGVSGTAGLMGMTALSSGSGSSPSTGAPGAAYGVPHQHLPQYLLNQQHPAAAVETSQAGYGVVPQGADEDAHPLFSPAEGEAYPTFGDPRHSTALPPMPWESTQPQYAGAQHGHAPAPAQYAAPEYYPENHHPVAISAPAPVSSVAFTPYGAQRRTAANPHFSHVLTAAEAPVAFHQADTATREVRNRFERADHTYYHGENLDQPTWRRRRIKLR
ncbi:MAG: hypothetical protein ACAI35_02105 [Candidatus Methylacidiphilales bacterium]|nr:hypothetical protein [Candidatus Methylacidiphilales bacterium]